MSVALAVLVGVAAGFVAGLLGVGGGILFVPALALLLGQGQVEAEATSLLAIVPVALVGAWRQERYGNVRVRDGLLVGALSLLGVLGGVALANALPERALEVLFGLLAVSIAVQVGRRGVTQRRERLGSEPAPRPRP